MKKGILDWGVRHLNSRQIDGKEFCFPSVEAAVLGCFRDSNYNLVFWCVNWQGASYINESHKFPRLTRSPK